MHRHRERSLCVRHPRQKTSPSSSPAIGLRTVRRQSGLAEFSPQKRALRDELQVWKVQRGQSSGLGRANPRRLGNPPRESHLFSPAEKIRIFDECRAIRTESVLVPECSRREQAHRENTHSTDIESSKHQSTPALAIAVAAQNRAQPFPVARFAPANCQSFGTLGSGTVSIYLSRLTISSKLQT